MDRLLWIGVALLIVWAAAWIVLRVTGVLIHLVAIVALIVLICWVVRRGRESAW